VAERGHILDRDRMTNPAGVDFCIHQSVRSSDMLYEAAGSARSQHQPFERRFRDIHSVRSNCRGAAAFRDRRRAHLGLETDTSCFSVSRVN